eukprot:TRINITY_DN31490_c0_g1_i1.p2 TRINITY_DN31490_c0_g1~~TRINITY_DN31490_c0_g1_i1.p2  ORF type:complete len:110 (-),score=12.26 TRINITY_DN31490_c0_g1_i1:270-599(-)
MDYGASEKIHWQEDKCSHMMIMVDMSDEDEKMRTKQFMDGVVSRSLQMGGTCTGEHGIGYGKLHNLINEHGKHVLDTMHTIKKALDPKNIMNPGKIGMSYQQILQSNYQ